MTDSLGNVATCVRCDEIFNRQWSYCKVAAE